MNPRQCLENSRQSVMGLSCSIDICNEIRKSQRSLLETTILEYKATIALHSDFKFDEVSPTIKATGNMSKSLLHVQGSTFWSRTRR